MDTLSYRPVSLPTPKTRERVLTEGFDQNRGHRVSAVFATGNSQTDEDAMIVTEVRGAGKGVGRNQASVAPPSTAFPKFESYRYSLRTSS
jgi:hypothetical protein